jgi:hypothetical protein
MINFNRGCRCLKCRVAYSAYDRERKLRKKNGTADFIVSGELASAHLWELSKAGMGLRAVSEVTGICRRNLYWIRQRKMRLRQSTEERIMRVSAFALRAGLKSAGAWMYSCEAREQVEEMLRGGWTQTKIAHAMGYVGHNLDWFRKTKMRVSTWVRFHPVYQQFKREQRKAA